MNPDFWRGKKVLLTGHTGFKGSWLSLWLQYMGAELTGYALPAPTKPCLFQEAKVEDHMTSIIGDIRDLTKLLHIFRHYKPEIVIHMAAQPLVRYSYENPVDTYATNVMGTVNLLECVRLTQGVKAVVNITSDKCYENKEWVWGYRENEPMGGFDPYSNSKGCAELVISAYRRSFFKDSEVAVASARAGNVIGGGDWATDRLIPDVLRSFEQRQSVIIRNPHATRPWQHVIEPLSGYLTLAEYLYSQGQVFATGWNFGPKDEDTQPVQWIVEHMVNSWGEGASWQLDAKNHPHEASHLKLDISKARVQLGWQPHWTLEKALELTTSWHQAYIAKDDMKKMCLSQIQQYLSIF